MRQAAGGRRHALGRMRASRARRRRSTARTGATISRVSDASPAPLPASEPGRPLRINAPSEVRAEPLVLRAWSADQVPALHEAILENREHLLPWMPWAALEPQPIEERYSLVEGWVAAMDAGRDWQCSVWLDDRLAGSAGLMQRRGAGILEIGYWVHRALAGRGVATLTSYLLTELAFETAGVERVQIWHDRANVASRRVPERLGYELVEEAPDSLDEARSPGEEGVHCVWEATRARWSIARTSGQPRIRQVARVR